MYIMYLYIYMRMVNNDLCEYLIWGRNTWLHVSITSFQLPQFYTCLRNNVKFRL